MADASNGAVETDRSKWPDRQEVARIRGCSVSSVRSLEKRGVLAPVLVAGVWRFDPKTVESAATEGAAAELTGAELLNAAAGLVRQAEAHNERLVELFTAPLSQLHTQFAATQERLLARIDQLEKKNAEMLVAGEEALSLQHDRHLKSLGFEASERRKSAAFEALLAQFPELASLARARFGMSATPAKGSPPNGVPPPATSPAPAAPDGAPASKSAGETPPIEPPPKDDDEAAFQVLRRVSCLSDEQIRTMERAGFITAGEAVAFRMHRDSLNKTEAPAAVENAPSSAPSDAAVQAETPPLPAPPAPTTTEATR